MRIVATAAITSSSFISTGFGDAALSTQPHSEDQERARTSRQYPRVNLTIDLVLGTGLAIAIWYASAAPFVVSCSDTGFPKRHDSSCSGFQFRADRPAPSKACSWPLFRAYRRDTDLRFESMPRPSFTIISVTCLLVGNGHDVLPIMIAMLLFACASALLQMMAAPARTRRSFFIRR